MPESNLSLQLCEPQVTVPLWLLLEQQKLESLLKCLLIWPAQKISTRHSTMGRFLTDPLGLCFPIYKRKLWAGEMEKDLPPSLVV